MFATPRWIFANVHRPATTIARDRPILGRAARASAADWPQRAAEIVRTQRSEIHKVADFTAVLAFSATGLAVSLGLSLASPFSQQVAEIFARFG